MNYQREYLPYLLELTHRVRRPNFERVPHLKMKDITDTVNDVCMVTVATLPNGLQLHPCCVPYGRLLFVWDITIMSVLDCMSCTNQSTLADLGGRARRTPPLWDPILSFSHIFSLKSAHIGGPHPPLMGACPPMGNPRSTTANQSISSHRCPYRYQ